MKEKAAEQRGRGRPSKFGRPSQLVALTLPVDVVRGLRKLDRDLAHAIVRVFEGTASAADDPPDESPPDVELVKIADRRSLIVIRSAVIRSLPGVNIVPLDGTRAFLALEPGRGISDLELAVIDRLDDALQSSERQALEQLRRQLRSWRRDPALRFHSRAILVVETLTPPSRARGPFGTLAAVAESRVARGRRVAPASVGETEPDRRSSSRRRRPDVDD